ncbi:MAG TPA: hypothetical protein PKV15_01170 [Syntrophomonadaceae bacterium]|jgi:hypothetical protein|nr:hypothetical protein [Syntrophomonadaceae bacterium]HRX20306.1 hypothetical protein [Syntrophomonadaceae bacterium]
MKHNLTTVFLLAIIIALLIPVVSGMFVSDPAFTPDNLVMLQMQNN